MPDDGDLKKERRPADDGPEPGTQEQADDHHDPVEVSNGVEADESGADAVEKDAAKPGRPGQPEDCKFETSDDLMKALEEAEAAVAKRAPAAAPPQKGEEEELEIEIETEDVEDDFDPNRVNEVEEESPPPPTAKEQELKLEILDLRRQVRDKEAEVEQRLKDMKANADSVRRLQRNFDGYKARVMKEKADQFNYGHEPIIKELLPVVDNLERALAHAEKDAEVGAVKEGVEMILRQFLSTLKKFGVEPIEAEGQEFNPEIHQAVAMVDNSETPNNHVLEAHQKGYMLKDRLLRAAMVVVSKKSADAADPGAPDEAVAGEEEGTGQQEV